MLHVVKDFDDDDMCVAYKAAYAILWEAADCVRVTGGIEGSVLFVFGKMLEQVIDSEGDELVKDAQAKARVPVAP